MSFSAFKGLSRGMIENRDEVRYYAKKLFGLSSLLILGGILLVLSGTGLPILTHAYGQLWFQVKMGLVAMLILNGILFGSRQEQKLKRALDATTVLNGESHLQPRQPMANLRTFYAIQLVLFLGVVVLAVVKPG